MSNVYSIQLINKLGLHARAASKLVQCCNSFSSNIEIKYNDKIVDAKSIMSTMLLAASCGSTLEFIIEGVDQQQAWQAIDDLISRRFDEEQ